MRTILFALFICLASFAQGQSARFDSMWVNYDVYEDGVKGMRIHLRFTAYGMKDMDAYAAIYFEHDDDLGDYLRDRNGKFNSTDGDVAVYRSIKPAYDPAVYNDLQLFMPYSELDLDPGFYYLSMDVKLIYKAGGVISRLTNYPFEYTKPGSSSGGLAPTGVVTFKDMWVDYDVTENGQKGMRIHVKFSMDQMKDVDAYLAIYFEYKNGTRIEGKSTSYRSTSGQLAIYKSIKPAYVETDYNDLQLFMPYSEINVPRGRHDLIMDVSVIYKAGGLIKRLKKHDFWYEH